jgi:hypothetical protein
MLEQFFRPFALGNVAVHDYEFRDHALGVSNRAGNRFQHSPASIFVFDPVLEPLARARLPCFAGCLKHAVAVLRVDLLEGGRFSQLGRGVSQYLFVCWTVV